MCEYDNRREWICTFDVDPKQSMYAGDYLLDVKEEIIRCVNCPWVDGEKGTNMIYCRRDGTWHFKSEFCALDSIKD